MADEERDEHGDADAFGNLADTGREQARLAVDATRNAVARRANMAGCELLRPVDPSQFRSRKFLDTLRENDLVGSMRHVGAASDNAAMESFFSLVQNNVLDRKRWKTREELRSAIVTWIESTYHWRRRQARLGRLTPIEYETTMSKTVTLAAQQPKLSGHRAAGPNVPGCRSARCKRRRQNHVRSTDRPHRTGASRSCACTVTKASVSVRSRAA